jgi:basic membrane protein A and related proteins
MRSIFAVSCVLALVFAIVPSAAPGGAAPAAAGQVAPGPRIGLVTSSGALADRSFDEYAWAGVQAGARAVHGTAEVIVPPANAEAYAWAIGWFADRDFDVIVTVGFQMTDATLTAATSYPAVQFFGIDQDLPAVDPPVIAPPNYQRLWFDEAEAGYLAGLAAATMSKTRAIGAIGGMMVVPPVLRFINGYRNGAAAAKSGIPIVVTYTDDFGRPDLGEDAAAALIAQDADVIFTVAGGSNLGAFGAACEAGVWAVGVDIDAYLQAPVFGRCILTSAEKRVATATALAIQRFATGGLQGGAFVNDAANQGIGLAPIRDVKPPKVLQDLLATALVGLANGSIDPCSPTACDTP